MKIRTIYTFFYLCLAGLALTACGIKPSELQPPSEQEQGKPFPSTYPQEATITE